MGIRLCGSCMMVQKLCVWCVGNMGGGVRNMGVGGAVLVWGLCGGAVWVVVE